MWDLFLGKKSRTGRTHYKLRRVCEDCGKPICDSNQSGYCCKCLRGKILPSGPYGRTRKAESVRHIRLKQVARKFLEEMGCDNIADEVEPSGGRFRFDVVGEIGKRRIAVECGGSRALGKKSLLVNKLFILPYGETIPVLWSRGTQICSVCGHRV